MLKYLFKADFEDGSSILQTQDDVSSVDPTRSAFFDVLTHESKLTEFHLVNEDRSVSASLTLVTGEFSLNGARFYLDHAGIPDGTYRLVYFRRHKHMSGTEGQSHEVSFFLGWQTTLDNKNIQRTITVS